MMMKNSRFLMISSVLGSGCGTGEGPTNDDKEFSFSAVFKCFRKRM